VMGPSVAFAVFGLLSALVTSSALVFWTRSSYEIPIHKELLLQTKLMQEFVKSIDCCCCKIEVFVPSLTKEELELLVKFLYCGEVICSNKSIASKVFSNLVQFFGFPECMEINGKPN
jgi:hypothetical protein